MKKRVLALFIFVVCLLISFVSAPTVGTSDMTRGRVVYAPPVFINYSIIATNQSNYWGSHFYTDYDLLVPYVGATSNVDLGIYNFTTSGRIGIGTETPTSPLEVANPGGIQISMKDTANVGDAALTGFKGLDKNGLQLWFFGDVWSGNSDISLYNYRAGGDIILKTVVGDGQIVFQLQGGVKGAIDKNGNLGLGTITTFESIELKKNLPSIALHNYNHDDTDGGRKGRLHFWGQQSGGEITTLARIEASHDGILDDEKGDLIFYTNDGTDVNSPTERMRIDSDGNIGIGTTTPTHELNVVGNANITGNTIFGGNGTFGGGALFKGAIKGDEPLGYENIRFGVQSHTPRIIFDNGSLTGQIDFVGNTLRFIINDTISGNTRARLRVNSTTVRVGENLDHSDFHVWGNIFTKGGGNAIIAGNVTAENVYLPVEIFAHTLSSQDVVVDGQWVNITFDEATPVKKRITHTYDDNTNDTFTIVDDGTYEFSYSIKVQDTINEGSNVGFRIIVNNEQLEGSYAEVDVDKKDIDRYAVGFVSGILSTDDEIKMQFTSNSTSVLLKTDGTFSDHDDTAKIMIRRIS